MHKSLVVLFSAFLISITSTAFARDQISVVGSSTVFPFATSVAEKFGQQQGFKTPVIESTGSGGGIKMFCKGLGAVTPDIANASRAIKKSEEEFCAKNGVTPIEYLIGYDGITFSNSREGEKVSFTKSDIFNAVSEKVLINGEWVDNPYTKWNEINPSLPDYRIDVMIPPTTSGTRDAFVELIMHDYCKKELKMSKKEYKAHCTATRTDIHVVQMGENDNLIIEKLVSEPKRFGVFGFSFLDQNLDKVQASFVNGVEPTFDTIADGSYTVSRPLFFYVKKEHIGVIPGIQDFVDAFMSEQAIGDDGYLVEQGLIPLQ